MSLMTDAMIQAAIRSHLPANDIRYCWHVEWLYEEDRIGVPHAYDHSTPKGALDHMIQIWNEKRTLIHLSVSRRNA